MLVPEHQRLQGRPQRGCGGTAAGCPLLVLMGRTGGTHVAGLGQAHGAASHSILLGRKPLGKSPGRVAPEAARLRADHPHQGWRKLARAALSSVCRRRGVLWKGLLSRGLPPPLQHLEEPLWTPALQDSGCLPVSVVFESLSFLGQKQQRQTGKPPEPWAHPSARAGDGHSDRERYTERGVPATGWPSLGQDSSVLAAQDRGATHS